MTDENNIETIQIPKELAQNLLNFLSQQRYSDVFQLINKLMQHANGPPQNMPDGTLRSGLDAPAR